MAEIREYNEINNSNHKIFENKYMKEIEDNIRKKKKIVQMKISYKLLFDGLKAQKEK